jgi:flagellar M-ring protein FliF
MSDPLALAPSTPGRVATARALDAAALSGQTTPVAAPGLLGRLAEVTAGQPALRRALPLLIVMAALVLSVVAFSLLRPVEQAILHPGMAETDKADAVEALRSAGLPARVDPDTGALEVPRERIAEARMLLAQAGLPRAVPSGYDVLAELPMGASRAMERARVKQAHETALAGAVMSIADVRSARVMLALPDPSPFVRDQAPPAASVFVDLASGRALGEGQVRAIQQLVASSVPGMARERVSVVDGAGTLLSLEDGGGAAGESARQLTHKSRLERAYLTRVNALLTPVLGVANFAAQVNLDLDFTEAQQTSERYSPQTSALRSEASSSRTDSSEPARGIPGAISNGAPPAAAQPADAPPPGLAQAQGAQPPPPPPGPRSSEQSLTRNWEVGREVAVTRPATGEIRRLSVAVVVRQTAPGSAGQPSTQTLERLIASAVGLNTQRGDQVTVVRQPFAATPPPPTPPVWQQAARDHAGHFVAVLAIVAALAAARMFSRHEGAATATTPVSEAGTDSVLSPIGADAPTLDGEAADALPAPHDTEALGIAGTAGDGSADGESADQLAKARTRGRKVADILSSANSYDDKIAAIRIFVDEDTARASSVMKQLLRDGNVTGGTA